MFKLILAYFREITLVCGRFSLTCEFETIQQYFKLTQSFFMRPRYNIAPSQKILIQIKPGTVDFFEWGLKIDWLKERQSSQSYINARAETIFEKPLFRQAIRKRRCLVISDGYYEWKTVGRQKQPYYIHRSDKAPFAIAGIFENDTVALITTQANSLVAEVHPRMPVILSAENYHNWLNPMAKLEDIALQLQPTLSEGWQIEPVSVAMNNPDFDNISCVNSLHSQNS